MEDSYNFQLFSRGCKRLNISSRSTFFANRFSIVLLLKLNFPLNWFVQFTHVQENKKHRVQNIYSRLFSSQISGSSRVSNGQIHFTNVLLPPFKFKGKAPAISAQLPVIATVERLGEKRSDRTHEPRIIRYLKQQSKQQTTRRGVELRGRIEGRVEEHVAEFTVELSPPATIQPWIDVSTTFPVRNDESRPVNLDRRQTKDGTAEYTDRYFVTGFSPVASYKLHPDIDAKSVPVRGSRLVPRPPVRYKLVPENR